MKDDMNMIMIMIMTRYYDSIQISDLSFPLIAKLCKT